MTDTHATRIVDRSLSTGETAERIASAQFAGMVKAMNPLQFAEQVGEMLLMASRQGDVRMGQSAMLWIAIRRGK